MWRYPLSRSPTCKRKWSGERVVLVLTARKWNHLIMALKGGPNCYTTSGQGPVDSVAVLLSLRDNPRCFVVLSNWRAPSFVLTSSPSVPRTS